MAQRQNLMLRRRRSRRPEARRAVIPRLLRTLLHPSPFICDGPAANQGRLWLPMEYLHCLAGALAGAALAISASAGDAVAKASPSTYCLSIDVNSEGAEALAKRFDAFADAAGLAIDASHPAMRIYYPPARNVRYPTDSSFMIVLRGGMGPLGSILSLMPLRDEPPAGFMDNLQSFVDEEIAKDYRTVLCEEIEGFTPPVVYR